jgi:hypothetical protein
MEYEQGLRVEDQELITRNYRREGYKWTTVLIKKEKERKRRKEK